MCISNLQVSGSHVVICQDLPPGWAQSTGRTSEPVFPSAQVAFEKMKVHISKKMFGQRVNWADDGDAYAKALPGKASS